MTPKQPNVSGWAPDFLPAEVQFSRSADALRGIVGYQISRTWVVWNLELDEWFADLPVVLQLKAGPQLEVCWEKFDDLSITWNTIDVTTTPRAWVEWPLVWRQAALPALAAVTGDVVRTIAASTMAREAINKAWHSASVKRVFWKLKMGLPKA